MDSFFSDSDPSIVPEAYIRNGKMISVNKSFTDFTGYLDEDIRGLSFPEFLTKKLKSAWVPVNGELPEKAEECFIFSKDLTAIKVKISVQSEGHSDCQVVSFIRKSTDLLQRIFNFLQHLHANSDTGFLILCADQFTVLKANKYVTDFTDRFYNESESCIGDTISGVFDRFGGMSFEQFRNMMPFSEESNHVHELRYDFPSLGVTYWDIILAPIREDLVIKYIVLVVREVTEAVLNRLRLEEQAKTIHHKNQQLQAIFDNVSDGLYIEDYSHDGITTLVNKHTADFFNALGIPPQNPEKIKNFSFYDRDGNPVSPKNLPITRIRRGQQYEQLLYTLRHQNGEDHLSVSGSPLYDAGHKLKMAILCIRLVTDRVNHERELQQQRDLYYDIFDKLGLPIIYFSYPEFNCQGLNRNSFNILTTVAKGTPLEKEIHPDSELNRQVFLKLQSALELKQEEFKKVFAEMEKKRETVFHNYEILREGKKIVYKLVIQPIIRGSQEIKEIIITAIDITYEIEQREAVERLVKMKDELVYTITHEFKTPLTVINSAIQAMELLCWNEMPARAKDYVKKIKQNSFRQLRLVNNLLDVNKISIGKMKMNLTNLDIVQTTRLITESVQVYAQQKGIRLVFSSSAESRIIGIDDEKYERVLLNLLSNAIKFTAGGKAVYVRISFKTHHQKRMACIEIEDEGIGIPEDKFDLIFERFGQVDSSLTRNVEGSGLGLTLVRQIVEAHGGEVAVKSRMGEGSVFTVFLPARKVPASVQKRNAVPFLKSQLEHITAMELSDIYL